MSYGGVRALQGISLHVDAGEIVIMIGANGAGKSTLINSISGVVQPASGEIWFEGKLLAKKPYIVVKDGVVQVPEGRQVFANLTVKSNLEMGGFLRNDKDEIARDIEYVFSVFPRLNRTAKPVCWQLERR